MSLSSAMAGTCSRAHLTFRNSQGSAIELIFLSAGRHGGSCSSRAEQRRAQAHSLQHGRPAGSATTHLWSSFTAADAAPEVGTDLNSTISLMGTCKSFALPPFFHVLEIVLLYLDMQDHPVPRASPDDSSVLCKTAAFASPFSAVDL